MQKNKIFIGLIALLVLFLTTLGVYQFVQMNSNSEQIDITKLSKSEQNGLTEMREEEKMARDIYLALYNHWGEEVFLETSKSEQEHSDILKSIIIRYNLKDPVESNDVGVYKNREFEKLYNELIALGTEDLEQALITGIMLEEQDIYDLDQVMLNTNNADLRGAYNTLSIASENHLRIFMTTIESHGLTYEPRFISQEKFDRLTK